jgi:hypothetical protein
MHELKAPKMAVADLMRLSTSESEVNELFIIDPRYLNSLVKSITDAEKRIKSATAISGQLLVAEGH